MATIKYREGDRVRSTRKHAPHGIKEGEEGTILAVSSDGTIRLELDEEHLPLETLLIGRPNHTLWVAAIHVAPVEYKAGDYVRVINEEELSYIGHLKYHEAGAQATIESISENMLTIYPHMKEPFHAQVNTMSHSFTIIKHPDHEGDFNSRLFRHAREESSKKNTYRTTSDGFSTCDSDWNNGLNLL